MKKSFITGFITGGIICAAVTGLAVEYAVTANPYPVKVNGSETAIEGYNINDNTYFKLRDVADAVGGFDVGFSDNTITIDTESAPEPTDAPTTAVTVIKGNDGKDYTSDGLEIHYVNDVAYVMKGYIQQKIEKKGFLNYSFGTTSLINTDTLESVIKDIPLCPTNSQLIPVEFYVSTLSPFIDSLK